MNMRESSFVAIGDRPCNVTRAGGREDVLDYRINAPGIGRVLMIAAAFPPSGGPGVQRTAKFAKYLPRFGWHPTIWTVEGMPGLPIDASLREELRDEVTVLGRPSPRGKWMEWVHHSFAGSTSNVAVRLRRLVDRFERFRNARRLPDEYIEWATVSLPVLSRLIRRESFDAIYSTFSPASNHWLAMRLKELSGLPWVADFRDLWTQDYRYAERSTSRRSAHRALERAILSAADAIIGVTERQSALLAQLVPGCEEKFLTIPNGFDPEDFNELEASADSEEFVTEDSRPKQRAFVIAHVGRLDKWRTGNALVRGLKEFAAAAHSESAVVNLRIVGHAAPSTLEKLRSTGLEVTFSGYVSHIEAVGEMQAADVLLLPLPDGTNADSVIAGKLFEYLAAGPPILVMGPKGGECEVMVRNLNAGPTVGFDSTAFAAALRNLHDAWRNGNPARGCSRDRLESYTRMHLTERLAGLFDRLAVKTPRQVTNRQSRAGRAMVTA